MVTRVSWMRVGSDISESLHGRRPTRVRHAARAVAALVASVDPIGRAATCRYFTDIAGARHKCDRPPAGWRRNWNSTWDRV